MDYGTQRMIEDLTLFSKNWRRALVHWLAKPDCAGELNTQLEDACDHAIKAEQELKALRAAVGTVLEGWTLPAGARSTLEAAYFDTGKYQRENVL